MIYEERFLVEFIYVFEVAHALLLQHGRPASRAAGASGNGRASGEALRGPSGRRLFILHCCGNLLPPRWINKHFQVGAAPLCLPPSAHLKASPLASNEGVGPRTSHPTMWVCVAELIRSEQESRRSYGIGLFAGVTRSG